MDRHAVLFLFGLIVLVQSAAGAYTVTPGYDHPPTGEPLTPAEVPPWELPLYVLVYSLCLAPLEILTWSGAWFLLRSRQSRPSLLDHPLRGAIYQCIRARPGIHLRALSATTGTPMGTLRYHLGLLHQNHKVTVLQEDGRLMYYENSGTYTLTQQRLLKHLRNPTTRHILCEVLRHPGMSRKEVAEIVGITGPAVHWHMKKLEEDGFVRQERSGRTTRYAIDEGVAGDLTAWTADSGDLSRGSCS
ncbi:winged helix-turn-helix transcriptional regulator [Methanofollis formosanus]|uniref:Winged helix-turn-helix transcriptional regulator n=1 Tax=Methanofollis formosanus TaxID=299308 RepID=A0A8G1A1P5_9EURY|nr:winged helix-turn-helix transcriptional regulator [Methanofollis formosanus]QYZ79401.1 winged helix-turn-helix transcriptional regulator [Methanofollis formosanus]